MEKAAAMNNDSHGFTLGSSLPVPNVQALVEASAGGLAVIPDRYVRPEMGQEAVQVTGGDTEEIPVVDLGRLLGDVDPDSRAAEAAKLGTACESWGIFQLVNHGIPAEVMGRMTAVIEGFFAQTLEEKMTSSKQKPENVEGYGQAFVKSVEQKLDWADMLYLVTQPPQLRNLALWPIHPPEFRATLEEYSLETKRVALSLLAEIGRNLGLRPEKLPDRLADGMHSIRINYYPPCRHHADRVIGLNAHSDGSSCLTVLLRLMPGLQIRRDGRWLPVEPLAGALIINIGDMLELMTNGRYKSIEHRVVVDRERGRISAATFIAPRLDGLISPLEELLAVDGEQPLYRTVTTEEMYKLLLARKLEGKNLLDSLKLDGP